MATGQLLSTFNGHNKGVWSVFIDGHTIYSGGDDSTIRQWVSVSFLVNYQDIRSGTCTRTIAGFTGCVTSLKVQNGILFCSDNNVVQSRHLFLMQLLIDAGTFKLGMSCVISLATVLLLCVWMPLKIKWQQVGMTVLSICGMMCDSLAM